MRIEHDTMGAVEVPDDAYYGAQTQRAVENFPISGKTMPPELIHALGLVKWACAKANADLGLLQSGRSPLSDDQIDALLTACLEVAEGKFDDQFPVDVYQTGSGTSTNMNANEVIARRANEIVEAGDAYGISTLPAACRLSPAAQELTKDNVQSINDSNQRTRNVGLSGLEGLAEGDGFDGGDLSVGEKTAERGNLCSVRPDAESGGLNTVEHSGGQRQELQQGIHPVSAHSEGIEVGIGNTTSDRCQGGLPDRNGHSTSNANVQRDRQHAIRTDKSAEAAGGRRQEAGETIEKNPASCLLPPAASIHPNDHVNMGQSTNDIFPTAILVALVIEIAFFKDAVVDAYKVLQEKGYAWEHVLKIGRTHLADATPMTLGQEFEGFADQMLDAFTMVKNSLAFLNILPVGGTAIGTGINTHPDFAEKVISFVNEKVGEKIEFVESGSNEEGAYRFEDLSSRFNTISQRNEIVFAHANIKSAAVTIFNIANNIRWLGSGPRAGFYEIIIPDLQPGSSIMPGKVNPVLCEALMQACARVIGNDQTMTFCGATGGQFQLNVMMPVMADTAIESVKILTGALEVFTEKCLKGLEANEEKCLEGVEKSLSLATALNPHIGYEKAAEIAKEAFKTGKTVRELCLEKGILSPEELEKVLDPWKMV